MSKLSEVFNERKLKELKRFFGEDVKVSNGNHDTVLHFTRVIDEDNIIIVTNNVKVIKENYVLIVGKNKVVYLKEWNVMLLKNWNLAIDTYAIKLSRKYFKTYEFKNGFDEFIGEDETFDDLLAVAREQESDTTTWKFGHYGF